MYNNERKRHFRQKRNGQNSSKAGEKESYFLLFFCRHLTGDTLWKFQLVICFSCMIVKPGFGRTYPFFAPKFIMFFLCIFRGYNYKVI